MRSESRSVMYDSLQPHGLYSSWNSPGQNTGMGSLSFSRDLPNSGIKPMSPTLQPDSLPTEPQGKPKKTGMGSLSLLQQIFLTQESNRGLLHCRQILYQLSYQGSPKFGKFPSKHTHWKKIYSHCPLVYNVIILVSKPEHFSIEYRA